MRKISVFILFSFFSIVLLVAQDLENITKQKPFQLHGALGFNFKSLSKEGNWSWGAGVATTGKEWGVNAGVGWKWR